MLIIADAVLAHVGVVHKGTSLLGSSTLTLPPPIPPPLSFSSLPSSLLLLLLSFPLLFPSYLPLLLHPSPLFSLSHISLSLSLSLSLSHTLTLSHKQSRTSLHLPCPARPHQLSLLVKFITIATAASATSQCPPTTAPSNSLSSSATQVPTTSSPNPLAQRAPFSLALPWANA